MPAAHIEIRMARPRIAVLAAVALIGVGLAALAVKRSFCESPQARREDKLAERRIRIRELDHRAFLGACRQLMHGARQHGCYSVKGDDPTLPSELLMLHASTVAVTSTNVWVEMGGGLHHFGLVAFAADDEGLDRFIRATGRHERLADHVWEYGDF